MKDLTNLKGIFEGMDVNFGLFWIVLAGFILADFVTGIIKGYRSDGKISSSKLRDGGFKKAGIIFTVILGYVLSKLFNDANYVIFHGVQAYYIYTELVSILENLEQMGVQLPAVLHNILGKGTGKNG